MQENSNHHIAIVNVRIYLKKNNKKTWLTIIPAPATFNSSEAEQFNDHPVKEILEPTWHCKDMSDLLLQLCQW